MLDKYNLISFAPSIAIVAAMIGMAIAGVILLKKSIAKDAAAAERK